MLLTDDTLQDSLFGPPTEQPHELFDSRKYAAGDLLENNLRRSRSQPTLKAHLDNVDATLRSSLNSLFEEGTELVSHNVAAYAVAVKEAWACEAGKLNVCTAMFAHMCVDAWMAHEWQVSAGSVKVHNYCVTYSKCAPVVQW